MTVDFPLISIIVPVYKVEYLKRCIDSILGQTYRNLEIILVDDESPYGAGQICDDYAAKDTRIHVIHKKNGGTSAARNAGLDICSGEIIYFVDDDDYVDSHMIADTVKKLIDTGADMVAFNMQLVYDGKGGQVFGWTDSHVNTLQIKEKILCVDSWEIWSKAYKKSLWENVRFPLDVSGCEDLYVIPRILFNARKITILPNIYYYFEKTEHGSISQHPTSKNFYCGWKAWGEHIYYMNPGQKNINCEQFKLYKYLQIQFALYALLRDINDKKLLKCQIQELDTFLKSMGMKNWKKDEARLLVDFYDYHILKQQKIIKSRSQSIINKTKENLLKRAMQVYVMNEVTPVLSHKQKEEIMKEIWFWKNHIQQIKLRIGHRILLYAICGHIQPLIFYEGNRLIHRKKIP